MKPLTVIDSPADWSSSGLKGRESEYTYVFSAEDTKELLAAVEKLKSNGVSTEEDVKKVLHHRIQSAAL